MKRIDDLSPYKTVLPLPSEIFGIYQPLIGGAPNDSRNVSIAGSATT